MKTRWLVVLLSAFNLSVLQGSDWAGDLPAESGALAQEDGLFGAPDFKFERNAAPTLLPDNSVGVVTYRHQFGADFDSLPGEVSVDQVSVGLPIPPLDLGDTHILAGLLYEGTKFDTTGPTMLTEDNLHAIRLPVVVLNDHSEKLIWGGMVMPSFAGDLSSSENFAISAAIGVGYAFSPTLTLAGGVFYSHGVDDDDMLLPGLVLSWRPTPKWEVFYLGISGGVSYAINDAWNVTLFGEYDSAQWQVEADRQGPDRTIEVKSVDVGVRVEHRISEQFWLRVSGGYSFARELEVESLGGATLEESDIDAGPFIRAGLSLRF